MCRHGQFGISCPTCDLESAQAIERGNETVFKGYGNSHFSHVKGEGFHETTEVPGLKQGVRIPIHNEIDE